MSAWELPTSILVNNITYPIRTDYRVVLDVLNAMNDPDLFEPDATEEEKDYVRCMLIIEIMVEDYEQLSVDCWAEALEKIKSFIDCGMENDEKRKNTRLMDWEQDAPIIIPAVNKVAGTEIRAVPYMHWWTFLGMYMEIGESLYSQVLSIRQKKQSHKKLEKWEQEFYAKNKSIIDLKERYSEEDQKEIDEWNDFFKKWGG